MLSAPATGTDPVTANHRSPGGHADLVVVGAGVAGLTVARTVLDRRRQARVVVLEAGDRPGGQVVTTIADGYTFEHGATAMLAPSDEVRALLDRLGLAHRIETAAAAAGSTSVWRDGRLHPLPRTASAAVRSRLLSWPGKARVLAEPLLGWSAAAPGETVYEFARRRFGREFADVLTGAFVQGVTAGDPRSTGLAGFSPRLWRMDRAAGRRGLIVGAIRQRRAGRAAPGSASGPAPGSASGPAARGPRPVTLRAGGLSVLVDALAAGLGGRLELRRRVLSIEAGTGRRLRVVDASGAAVETDTLVLAVPAYAAARLVATVAPALADALDTITHTDLRVVGLGYPRAAFPHLPRGFGFLSPPGEGLEIIGATVSSNAFEEQAPPGQVLVRAFAGGVFHPEVVDLPTEAAVDLAHRDIVRVLGVRGRPEFVRDVVWRRAIPQYGRQHVDTLRRVDGLLGTVPGLHLTGNSYRGVGLDDTFRDALRLGRLLADTALSGAGSPAPAGPDGAGSEEER